MKILITVNTYYPNKDGVEFVTKYLAEGLASINNNSVEVLTSYANNGDNQNEVINKVKIKRFNIFTSHTIHHGEKDRYIKYVINNQEKFDVLINVGTQTAFTDWLLPYLKEITLPKILYIHSIWDFNYHKWDFNSLNSFLSKSWPNVRWKLYYNKWSTAFKNYNAVIQLHKMDYSCTFFKKKYGIDSLIFENAAANSFFETRKDTRKDKGLGIHLPSKYILNVANYDSRKNQIECLKTFLKAELPDDVSLVFVGSRKNSYYNKLVSYYNKNNRSNKKNAYFLTDIPRYYMPDIVSNASLFFLTSKWEAFPISIIEAMASGVPFISSNVGIVRFLPGGVTFSNENEARYWLEELFRKPFYMKDLGTLGHRYALKYLNVDEKVSRFYSLLKKIVGESK